MTANVLLIDNLDSFTFNLVDAIHRLGANYEGVLRRYQRRADDTIRDTVMFGLPVEEWPEAREALLARLAT